MVLHVLLWLGLAAPVLAGGAPRAGASAARPSAGTVVTGVASVPLLGATGLGMLTPAPLNRLLALTPGVAAPAPALSLGAVITAPADAPLAALPALPDALAAAAPVVDAPVGVETLTVAAEAGAAPAPGTLGVARMAAGASGLEVEVIFDGGKPRKPFFSWPSFGRAPRIAGASLTRGGPARDLDRYVEPPRLARRLATTEFAALSAAGAALASLTVAGGALFLGFAGLFLAVGIGQYHAGQRQGAASLRRLVMSDATTFETRAQRLLDDMLSAVGNKRRVTVRILRQGEINAAYAVQFPDTIFLTWGAQALDDGRLRAVMAHELGHRAFGDNYYLLRMLRGALEATGWAAAGALFVKALLPGLETALFGAPLGWISPALLVLGWAAAWGGGVALSALPRHYEFRADHYGGWLTHPLDMAAALRQLYKRSAVLANNSGSLRATHPDTRRRIIELRGREAVAAAKGRMPAGVKDVFAKAAIMVGAMGALHAALWAFFTTKVATMTWPVFALGVLPLSMVPVHFALVAAFWAGRYWVYPKLGPGGRAAFRRGWTAAGALYAGAALFSLAAWSWTLACEPLVFLPFVVIMAFAAGEVVHHFVYRLVPERAADKDKGVFDWRSRIGGNIGQQLSRMSRKGA